MGRTGRARKTGTGRVGSKLLVWRNVIIPFVVYISLIGLPIHKSFLQEGLSFS